MGRGEEREGKERKKGERERDDFGATTILTTFVSSLFLQVMTLLTKAAALRWLY